MKAWRDECGITSVLLSDLEQGQERIVCRGSAPSQRHHNCKLPPTSPAHAIQSPPSRLLRAVQGREKQHFPTNPRPHPSPGRDRADPGAEIRHCPHHPGRAVCVLTPIAPRRVWECSSALQIPWDGAPEAAPATAGTPWSCCCPLESVPLCVTRSVGLRDSQGRDHHPALESAEHLRVQHQTPPGVRPLTCLSFPTHHDAALLGTHLTKKPQ